MRILGLWLEHAPAMGPIFPCNNARLQSIPYKTHTFPAERGYFY
jgi:hypothetical protein